MGELIDLAAARKARDVEQAKAEKRSWALITSETPLSAFVAFAEELGCEVTVAERKEGRTRLIVHMPHRLAVPGNRQEFERSPMNRIAIAHYEGRLRCEMVDGQQTVTG